MKRAYVLLDQIKNAYQQILGDTLTGIYVQGSLAFSCFRFECSDIDFLVVTEVEPTLEQKEAMIQSILDLNPLAPPKGFEMSVILKEDCQHFHHPGGRHPREKLHLLLPGLSGPVRHHPRLLASAPGPGPGPRGRHHRRPRDGEAGDRRGTADHVPGGNGGKP